MTSSAMRPETLHPRIQEVLDYLDVHRRQLLDTIASVPAKVRDTRPSEGRWSVAEVASFDHSDRVIDRSRKIDVPAELRPSGSLNAEAGMQALEQARAAMATALRSANGVSLENVTQAHPVLGTMNMYHWMVATALHEDRHAAQIREIGQSLAAG